MILRKMTFCKQKTLFPWWSACGSSRRWSADMLKNSKWRSQQQGQCSVLHPQRCKYWKTMVLYHIHSCMSEKLYIFNKHISKVCFVRIQSRGYRNRKPILRIRFLWFGLRETQSYNIDESVWYNYVYNIYAKLNLFIKSLFKLLINLLH